MTPSTFCDHGVIMVSVDAPHPRDAPITSACSFAPAPAKVSKAYRDAEGGVRVLRHDHLSASAAAGSCRGSWWRWTSRRCETAGP